MRTAGRLVQQSDAVWPEYHVFVYPSRRGGVSTLAVLRKYVGLYGWPDCEVREATPEEVAAYLRDVDGVAS